MKLDNPNFNALYMYTKALSVALGYRDVLTRLHSERVQNLSASLGTAYGLNDEELAALKIAASFHDVGKIGIPDHILLKPAKFDEYEWEKMKQHSEIGEKIIASTELDGAEHAARVIRHHHENYDGSGYPDGLAGTSISVCSRIITIADNYDAMAVTRSYHNAKTHPEVMQIMREETGRKHDPELMRLFCEIIETSPYKTTMA
ncbi:MAG: HD domain-containing protein [Gammaproteobacteria bacterium]|nr:HD domain-containing protein [Gammaproteobacteria bacterium]MBU1775984.1 HD domain-containing protein [Gammaproteobacteria bacterium]MBU1968756.1 HD domain-containing protein [Gammaproteobacteria bacterium]